MPAVDTAIRQGDCIELMREMAEASVDLVFADPPFNIGYKYDQYHDEKSDDNYLDWSRAWMEEVHRVLTPTGSFWLAIGDEYAADLKVIADRQIGFTSRSWVIWYYTFGVNCTRKFSRSHAHLLHFIKDPDQFTFNADDPAVRIPSARALVYGDKRANPKGRLPDDTWILRPQDFQCDHYGFDPLDDTWYFSRVAGTFKERQGFHGCQMPEQLLGRIVRISSNSGDTVLDPFAGSGTTVAVAKKLGRTGLGCELSDDYVRYASERLDSVSEGDPLNGPADPIASAPNTASGRRLKGQPLLPTFNPEDFSPPESATEDNLSEDKPSEENPPATEAGSAAENSSAAPAAPMRPKHPANEPTTNEPSAPPADLRTLQRQVLGEAYLAASQGLSVDRLIANPDLQSAFHKACDAAGLFGGPRDWNHELLRLRKSGALPKQRLAKVETVTAEQLDAYQFAAEIAWQLVGDKFKTDSIDEILSHPDYAAHFDKIASRYAPGFAPADYRWAALDFRKSRHTLAAEAKAYDYVFKTRDFANPKKLTATAANKLAGQAGVYLLYGAKRVPLYVGETLDLGARLATHLAASATKSKATSYAAILESDLPSSEYRAPLKVDLVGRYETAWNLH